MDRKIQAAQDAILMLNPRQRIVLNKWLRDHRGDDSLWYEKELTLIWDYMRKRFLEYDEELDISVKSKKPRMVVVRSHIFNHILNDWLYGIQYETISKVTGYAKSNISDRVVSSRRMLSTDRNLPMWKEVHELNDMVLLFYNQYIKR